MHIRLVRHKPTEGIYLYTTMITLVKKRDECYLLLLKSTQFHLPLNWDKFYNVL